LDLSGTDKPISPLKISVQLSGEILSVGFIGWIYRLDLSVGQGLPMSRENAQAKGERYLLSGRLTVRLVTPERIDAFCKGDSGHIYRVIHDAGMWSCSCPAKQRCAHLVALKRVVSRPGTEVLR
jgi:hypothetical protein